MTSQVQEPHDSGPSVSPDYESLDPESRAWAAYERSPRAALLRERARASADARHFARTGQLAFEGALSLLISTSVRDVFDRLMDAGRKWEEDYTYVPRHAATALLQTRTSA